MSRSADLMPQLRAVLFNTRCHSCGSDHYTVHTLGPAFQARELRAGRPDPGRLCAECAGQWTRMLRLDGLMAAERKLH